MVVKAGGDWTIDYLARCETARYRDLLLIGNRVTLSGTKYWLGTGLFCVSSFFPFFLPPPLPPPYQFSGDRIRPIHRQFSISLSLSLCCFALRCSFKSSLLLFDFSRKEIFTFPCLLCAVIVDRVPSMQSVICNM